jgi:hypothetical protein
LGQETVQLYPHSRDARHWHGKSFKPALLSTKSKDSILIKFIESIAVPSVLWLFLQLSWEIDKTYHLDIITNLATAFSHPGRGVLPSEVRFGKVRFRS